MTDCCNYQHLYLPEDAPLPTPIRGKYLINGEIKDWEGSQQTIYSPIFRQGSTEPTVLGTSPLLNSEEAVLAVEAASKAYDNGRGVWPQMSTRERIEAVTNYIEGVRAARDEIVQLLMWEICKNKEDSEKEVDRTVKYVLDTIKELKDIENRQCSFSVDGGIIAQIRRSPIGVCLISGPFNYPFNETYTTLIPAILMGNAVVMKLPRCGVLCHTPTLELFKKFFPPGVVNVVAGSGRATLPAIMATGKIDVLAFIGTSQASDALQKAHPKPHRLRICLGLEAKNPAIVLPCADLDVAVNECILGSLSFNGQRCTAIKIILVHEDIAGQFVPKFCEKVDQLKMGLPWEAGVKLTPLPEEGKPGYLKELISDALDKGAKIVNKKAGFDRTFVFPTVLYPVNSSMRVYHEEQFGPLVAITTFKSYEDISSYLAESNYGQQASIFTKDPQKIAQLSDLLVNMVARVNINCQCQRGPDTFPFTGRKDSAYGTLSVYDALRVFSIRAVVATKQSKESEELFTNILQSRESNFIRVDYMF